MKKGNILFVSLICVASLAGSAFCADAQNKKIEKDILVNANESVKSLSKVLSQEKNQQDLADSLGQVGAKLNKVKHQYTAVAGDIEGIFSTIKEIASRANQGGRSDFVAQNLITPFERDLSPALITLKSKNTAAFYATMNIIDTKYNTRYGSVSLSFLLNEVNGYMPQASAIKDKDGLINSLNAEPYQDAIKMLNYLQKNETANSQIVQSVRKDFEDVIGMYGAKADNESFWGQNLENSLETFEKNLRNLKASNKKLFESIVGIINRQYTTENGTASIADMVLEVNSIFGNLPKSAQVKDPQEILISMDAYTK